LGQLYSFYEELLKYYDGLLAFLSRLADGAFIHANLESLLLVGALKPSGAQRQASASKSGNRD
jgi:hypothetical protein